MANEKPLFNKKSDKDGTHSVKGDGKHAIAKDMDLEFVDFSAAFNDDVEEENTEVEEYEEEFEELCQNPANFTPEGPGEVIWQTRNKYVLLLTTKS